MDQADDLPGERLQLQQDRAVAGRGGGGSADAPDFGQQVRDAGRDGLRVVGDLFGAGGGRGGRRHGGW